MLLRIGHRGAAGTHPENTLASFRHAVTLGVDGIECDVHRTADGHLVVIHDPSVDRTTSGTGLIMALSLAEIQSLDAGSWKGAAFAGERVPTLRQVLNEIPVSVKLFIEMKAGSQYYPGIEEELLALLREENSLDRAQISSFDHQALHRLHQINPTVPLGMLTASNLLDPIGMARAIGATALHPTWEWVSSNLVEAAHQAGLPVHAWTVNLPLAIQLMKGFGVDGIMSDFPDRI
jgi:glycerophosphoryl diester phosphodiesterase